MKRPRPRLHKISEEMKAWSAALHAEVSTWPQVSTRPMFGFHALFRRKKIFAALPKTRTMDPPDSISFKLPKAEIRIRKRAEAEKGMHVPESPTAGWITLEIHGDKDLQRALKWLEEAYSACR